MQSGHDRDRTPPSSNHAHLHEHTVRCTACTTSTTQYYVLEYMYMYSVRRTVVRQYDTAALLSILFVNAICELSRVESSPHSSINFLTEMHSPSDQTIPTTRLPASSFLATCCYMYQCYRQLVPPNPMYTPLPVPQPFSETKKRKSINHTAPSASTMIDCNDFQLLHCEEEQVLAILEEQ